MTASLGKALVNSRLQFDPGKEAVDAPAYPKERFQPDQSGPQFTATAIRGDSRPRDGDRGLGRGKGGFRQLYLYPIRDALRLPLAGPQPRSLLSGGGGSCHRLAVGLRPQVVLAGD